MPCAERCRVDFGPTLQWAFCMQNLNDIAVNKYNIDPEFLYQDFTIAGSDWGTLFSALLSNLLLLQKEEKFIDAIKLCDVLLKYEVPYASGGPFLIKCECLVSLRKFDEAAAAYETYIANAVHDTDTTIKYAYYNLGNIYFELKRYVEAKNLFTRAHEIDPLAGGPKGMLEKVEDILVNNYGHK